LKILRGHFLPLKIFLTTCEQQTSFERSEGFTLYRKGEKGFGKRDFHFYKELDLKKDRNLISKKD